MNRITKSDDIILILPPKRFKEHRYSLGLMYISGYLRDNGYDNTIIESKILGGKEYQYDRQKARCDIIEMAIKLKPKVIGFTATTVEINEVIWLNQQIRSQINSYSIIGGSHVSAVPKEAVKAGFDMAIIGEGELTVLELIKEMEKDNPDFSKINGIAWLDKNNNQVMVNPPREYLDVSNMSFPAYDKVNMDYYTRVWDDVIRGFPIKAVMVMASKGCPYGCTFCGCNRIFGRKIRYRDFDNIKEEIMLLRDKYGVEGIWFADDTLTVNIDHVERICQIMKDLNMYWGAQSRVDQLNDEIVKLMKESGCLQLDFGVESGNQRVLDEIIKKQTRLEDVIKAFDICRKYGIRTEASFIFGLPGETRKEMEDSFKFAEKIKATHYSFNIFNPLPGTELYDNFFKNENITSADYQEISFHKIQDRFNKSEVRDLELFFNRGRQKIFEKVKLRGWSRFFEILVIWLKLGNKRERLSFILFKIKRASKYFLNKLGLNFAID